MAAPVTDQRRGRDLCIHVWPGPRYLEEPGEIVASIRSRPEMPRRCATEETLIELCGKIGKHIKNSYLRRLDTPLGVKLKLKCRMDLDEKAWPRR